MPVVTRSQSKLFAARQTKLAEKLEMDYYNKKCFITLMSKKLKETNNKKMTDKLRLYSEIFYIIRDWFDVVICVDGVIRPDMKRFLEAVFNKSNEFLVDVYKVNIETEEEHLIQKIFMDEVNATRDIVRPYIISSYY